MSIDEILKEWIKLLLLVPPPLRQWTEQTVQKILDSPQVAQVMRQQLARDIRQKSQANPVLNDPRLTIEDKITLLLMLIAKQMDEEITRQASLVQAETPPPAPRPPGWPVGGPPMIQPIVPPTSSGISVDVEMQKLKRMIDKRNQMFDMLGKIMDQYNERSKSVIQNIR
jgi:hypothetical protein